MPRVMSMIKMALERRDDRAYERASLLSLQQKEVTYAEEGASTLYIPLYRFQKNTRSSLNHKYIFK